MNVGPRNLTWLFPASFPQGCGVVRQLRNPTNLSFSDTASVPFMALLATTSVFVADQTVCVNQLLKSISPSPSLPSFRTETKIGGVMQISRDPVSRN